MPKKFQGALKRSGLYERLKESCIYDLYYAVADRRRIKARSAELSFYRGVLDGFRPGDLIFDIGANVGEKADIFTRLGARVVAVEPDRDAQRILREKFLRYRLTPKPVVIVDKAVSDKKTTETMWIDDEGSALNTLSLKWVETLKIDKVRLENGINRKDFKKQKQVETTTLEQLMADFGPPFFVKIDVEGYEPNVLRGLRQPVPYLSFEVNLPEFRPEGQECIHILSELAPEGVFDYASDCGAGLQLHEWLRADEFSRVFDQCAESSIEVFWKAPSPKLSRSSVDR